MRLGEGLNPPNTPAKTNTECIISIPVSQSGNHESCNVQCTIKVNDRVYVFDFTCRQDMLRFMKVVNFPGYVMLIFCRTTKLSRFHASALLGYLCKTVLIKY